MIHELKILPQFLYSIYIGEKRCEIRKEDDRHFKKGDYLLLREWTGTEYTGSALLVKVTHILRHEDYDPIPEGLAILSIDRKDNRLNRYYDPNDEANRMCKTCRHHKHLPLLDSNICDIPGSTFPIPIEDTLRPCSMWEARQ